MAVLSDLPNVSGRNLTGIGQGPSRVLYTQAHSVLVAREKLQMALQHIVGMFCAIGASQSSQRTQEDLAHSLWPSGGV